MSQRDPREFPTGLSDEAGRALIQECSAKLSHACMEMAGKIGTDSVVLLLVAMAGSATRRSGRPVEQIIACFKEMLANEFNAEMLFVDVRGDEPERETVQ